MSGPGATARIRTPVTAASQSKPNRSNRLRRQGRIPKSDGDVKEAHRKTDQYNESLRKSTVSVEKDAVITPNLKTGVAVEEGEQDSPPSSTPPSSASNTKASILIEIMSASPINIESTIAQHSDDIDPELLRLLEGRIAAARQLEQDDDTINGLIALFRRLKSEYERRTASPAMRLLDTLMSMMMADDDDGAQEIEIDIGTDHSNSRTRKHRTMEDTTALVRARMQLAFDDSLSLDTDVFTVAQQLAVGERRFVDELINEQVDGGEFIKEVEELLERAVKQQVAGKTFLEGMGSGGPGEHDRLRQALEQREKTIECVEELLVQARKVFYHRR